MTFEEFSGWIGAVLVLVAYYLVTVGKANGNSTTFQMMNIIGAIFLIYYTYNCKAYASMAVNTVWVIIGLGSFVKSMKGRDKKIYSKLILKSQKSAFSDEITAYTDDFKKALN